MDYQNILPKVVLGPANCNNKGLVHLWRMHGTLLDSDILGPLYRRAMSYDCGGSVSVMMNLV